MILHELQVAREVIKHGAKDDIERLLLVVDIEQVMHVRDPHFGREARINGAALGAFLVERLAREV